MSKLAIVVPAYKSMYFDEVLRTLANQTCQDFTLYVGIDGENCEFDELIKQYILKIHIEYRSFKKNIGNQDLIAHWERCIDMVGKEEWIWFFSDDDAMDPTCVEKFFIDVNNHPEFDIFHFNVFKIDTLGHVIGRQFTFPSRMTRESFLLHKIEFGNFSTAVEYIFRKSRFFEVGRFQKFDLGWHSDDATWIKLSGKNGIKTIDGPRVYWRISAFNISPNSWDRSLQLRKVDSEICFLKWICNEIQFKRIDIPLNEMKALLKRRIYINLKYRISSISFKELVNYVSKISYVLNIKRGVKRRIAILWMYKMVRSIRIKIIPLFG